MHHILCITFSAYLKQEADSFPSEKNRSLLLFHVRMLVFRRLSGKMVAEAFHCTNYESGRVADTAIFSNLTIQSADEKVIITMHTVQKARQIVGYVKGQIPDGKTSEAIMKNWSLRLDPSGNT